MDINTGKRINNMPRRRADRIDDNQSMIVKQLRAIPGITVETGKDDILVGCCDRNGVPRTWWFEIKNPDTISKKTGEIIPSKIKSGQKELCKKWLGQYDIVTSLDEIINVIFKQSI
jgi:hypothetical protein